MKNRVFLLIPLIAKRLWKHPAYLALLILIPLSLLVFAHFAGMDNTLYTVAIYTEGEEGSAAHEFVRAMAEDVDSVRFLFCDDTDYARELVESGRADAAWILPEDLEDRIRAFAHDPESGNAVIQMLVKDEDAFHLLLNDVLFSKLFAPFSRQVFLDITAARPELASLSEEERLAYYDTIRIRGEELFTYSYLDEALSPEPAPILLSPIRGMFAALLLILALSGAMLFEQDREKGVFAVFGKRAERFTAFLYSILPLIPVFLATLPVLFSIGVAGGVGREIALMAAYSLAASALALAWRLLCGGVSRIGASIPLFILGALILSPVFVQLPLPGWLQVLFPIGFYCSASIPYLLVYALAASGIYAILSLLRRRA